VYTDEEKPLLSSYFATVRNRHAPPQPTTRVVSRNGR